MLILVKLIGMVVLAKGIILLLVNPGLMKQFIAFWAQGRRIYLIGIFRTLLGGVFLLAAPQCRLVGVIFTLGALILISGMVIFILGIEKMKTLLNWWNKKPLLIIRLIGLLVLAAGALIVYSV